MQHLFSVGIFPLLLACNQKSKPDANHVIEAEVQQPQGQISISLTTQANGITYRLNLPSITLIGEKESIELNLIGEEEINLPLTEGTWQVVIGSGWSVYKITEERSAVVNAKLLHEPSQKLLITTAETTSTLICFSTDQEILQFA